MMPARSPLPKHVMWCASTLSVVQTAVAIAMSRSSAAHEKQDPRPSCAAKTQRLLAILPPRDRRGAEHAAPPSARSTVGRDRCCGRVAVSVSKCASERSFFPRAGRRRVAPRRNDADFRERSFDGVGGTPIAPAESVGVRDDQVLGHTREKSAREVPRIESVVRGREAGVVDPHVLEQRDVTRAESAEKLEDASY